ncbi:MAG: O-antigen ligase family protein [Planctomycetes bacterium]|nr:O-antigen ligase family protein [Planctomycetota bacterium]
MPVQVAAIGLITVPAWLLGGVEPGTQCWLFLVALCAVALCWFACLGRQCASVPLPAALIPLALAIIAGILQLVPLPPEVHRWVSPGTARSWEALAPRTSASGPESLPVAADANLDLPVDKRQDGLFACLVAGTVGDTRGGGYPISLYPESTRRDLGLLILAGAAFFLGAVSLSGRLGFLIAGILVAINGAALSFFGLAQQLTWNGQLYWSIPLTGGGVPFASYVNRNNAAGFLNMCLACAVGACVWALSRNREREASSEGLYGDAWANVRLGVWRRLWRFVRRGLLLVSRLNAGTLTSLAVAACIAAGILCSLSRGATVAMIGAAGITVLAGAFAGRARRGWVGLIIVASVAACLLVAYLEKGTSVTERLRTIFDQPAQRASGRIVHWQDGSRAAGDFLSVGSGLGTYRYVYRMYQRNRYDEWYYHAENQYLEALVETGLPGLSLLLLLIGLVAFACWRLLKQASDPATYALAVAGTFALSSQAIHAFFDFGLYMPANMLLFALLCGVVCGRAARLEQRSPTASRWTARMVSRLVSLPHRRPLAASCCVALACGLFVGYGQTREAAVLDSALSLGSKVDVERPGPLDALDRSIARFGADRLQGTEDAEAQLMLAQLWINRLRVQLVQAMREDEAAGRSEQALWRLTDTANLHGWAQHLATQRRTAESDILRNRPPVLENLPHALRHLRLARRSCPLLPEPHLLLAQLSVLETDDMDNRRHLERVRRTGRGTPEILTRCGLLELQAGRTDLACKSWQMSLELAIEQLPDVVKLARPHLDLAAHVPQLVPNSPDQIIRIAETHFADEGDRKIRQSLLDTAEGLLSEGQFDEGERRLLLGRIASLRNAHGQAVRYFTEALAMHPENNHWRYELAVALKQAGRLPEAQEQARVCVRTDPENEQYEALLREVIRAQLSSRRRSHADI